MNRKHNGSIDKNTRKIVMEIIKTAFKSNHEHYEGMRPINIYLLRLFFF